MKIVSLSLSCIIFVFFISCQSPKEFSPGEGYVQLKDGKVWYRIVGEGDKSPLLLLHGGPGATSYYLNPMAELGSDRPVIFWDQLGCGRSPAEIDTSKLTVAYFVEQLEEFRQLMGIDEFYLYGHSWGTMLGLDYYLKYPEAVKAMILASPALSISRWTQDANSLISYLPDSIQNIIQVHSEAGTYESAEFQQAVGVYYQNYVARKQPWSADMDSTFDNFGEAVYLHMWGPTEFTSTGILKNYERADRLPEIKVPTLFMAGEFDEATPASTQYFQSLVPNSKLKIISNAAHITMHDNTVENNQVIAEFLRDLD
jgi:proline iminopeptidase